MSFRFDNEYEYDFWYDQIRDGSLQVKIVVGSNLAAFFLFTTRPARDLEFKSQCQSICFNI